MKIGKIPLAVENTQKKDWGNAVGNTGWKNEKEIHRIHKIC